jgi:hypothetical protein
MNEVMRERRDQERGESERAKREKKVIKCLDTEKDERFNTLPQ